MSPSSCPRWVTEATRIGPALLPARRAGIQIWTQALPDTWDRATTVSSSADSKMRGRVAMRHRGDEIEHAVGAGPHFGRREIQALAQRLRELQQQFVERHGARHASGEGPQGLVRGPPVSVDPLIGHLLEPVAGRDAQQCRDRGRQHRRGEDLAVAGSRHVAQSDHHQQVGGLHQSHHSCDHDRADQKAIHLASGGIEGAGHEGERDQGGDGEGDEPRPVRKADYGVQSQGARARWCRPRRSPSPATAGGLAREARPPDSGPGIRGLRGSRERPTRRPGPRCASAPVREPRATAVTAQPTAAAPITTQPDLGGHPAVRRHDEQDRQQGRESR